MAYTFSTNLSPTTGAVAMFNLKARLVAAGHVVKASSDGTTYNATGDQITQAGSGAGGMANNSAWFRVQAPDGGREFVIQRGTGNVSWRITYSGSAKFITGAPTATVVPSAADSALVHGGGTDASPTFASFFNTDGTYRQQIAADNTAPYAWYSVTYANGGGVGFPGSCLALDPVLDAAVGDADPAVIITQSTTASGGGAFFASTLSNELTSSTTPRCCAWLRKGEVGLEGFVTMPAIYGVSGGVSVAAYPANMGSNPHTTKDERFPLVYGRRSTLAAPFGYKGISRLMKWHGTLRATPSTSSGATAKDRLILGDVSFVWDGVTDPIA